MSGITPIFRGTTGLYDTLPSDEIPFDAEARITALAEAVNVTVSDSGRYISTRKGFVRKACGVFGSLFCDTGDCLVVRGDTLYRVNHADPSLFSTIESGFNGAGRVDFAQVGDDIYYTSATKFGLVRGGGVLDLWAARPYVGPDTNKVFSGPFPARHIAFFASRIFLSIGNLITFSEPFAYSWFDIHGSTLQFDSTVLMMLPVDGGMFISTESATYFLKGREPKDFQLIPVASYPAIEWSSCSERVDGIGIGMQEPGPYAVWNSTKGLCLGSPSGALFNLTMGKVSPVIPAGSTGAGVIDGFMVYQLYNDGTGISYNLLSKAATRLSGLPFSSMCKSNGSVLMTGSTSNCLSVMDGATDNGAAITAWFSPATIDMGSDKPKHIRFMYFGFKSSGNMQVEVPGNYGATRQYDITGNGGSLDQRGRVAIGRSAHHRYWSYKVSNKSGSSFSVGAIDCLFIERSHGFSETS